MPSLTEPTASQGFRLMGLDTETLPVGSTQNQPLIFHSQKGPAFGPPNGSYSVPGWGTSRTVQDVQAPQPC